MPNQVIILNSYPVTALLYSSAYALQRSIHTQIATQWYLRKITLLQLGHTFEFLNNKEAKLNKSHSIKAQG